MVRATDSEQGLAGGSVITVILLALSVSLAGCGGDTSTPTGPPIVTTAAISGTVRAAATGLPIAGAVVTVGAQSVTTGQDGRFSFQNLATTAPISITIDAPGFDRFAVNVTLQSGANTRDVSLVRSTIVGSGDFVAYLPPSVSTYRGVLFILAGSSADSRPFVRGEPVCFAVQIQGITCPNDPAFRARLVALAEQYALAIVGAKTGGNGPFFFDAMIAGVEAIAQLSGRSELASAPLLLVGSSLGGCIAHDFTRIHHARVIGFMSAKGSCHLGGVSPGGYVPGYLIVSEEDPVSPNSIVTIPAVFRENRAAGALWALMIDPGGGHQWPRNNDVTVGWMEAVLTARLPLPGQTGLRAIQETSGWLGDQSTLQIGSYACFGDGKREASWLPTEPTARGWHKVSSGDAPLTVRSCS
jgi:hypothetical protein